MASVYCWPIITGEERDFKDKTKTMFDEFKPHSSLDQKDVHAVKANLCKVPGCRCKYEINYKQIKRMNAVAVKPSNPIPKFDNSANSSRFNNSIKTGLECNFCKRNSESKAFYSTHVLKDSSGNVVCPILREHSCEICGATGNRAHTKSYCPRARYGDPNAIPVALTLKLSEHDSSGKLRKGCK